MDIAKLSVGKRVKYGRQIEEKIKEALRTIGKLTIEDPNDEEDRICKIDGWMIGRKGEIRIPIQIKYRESGEDILFEIFKDWNSSPCKIGRDYWSKAEYYIVLNKSKNLIVITPVADLKERVRVALDGINPNKRGIVFKNEGLEIRTSVDPHSGIVKLMGFIPFGSVEAIKKIEVDPRFFII